MSVAEVSAKRFLVLGAGLVVWAAALYGSTQLHTLDLATAHNICGPWGCAAKPESLLGYHSFWAALLVPIVALVCRVNAGPTGKRLALATGLVGLLGIVVIFGYGAITWARAEGQRYAVQRGLFDVATTPDLPVMPLTLAGAVGVLAARPSIKPEPQPVDPGTAG